jgi:hypothetical protein
MYAYGNVVQRSLAPDDINGVRALYPVIVSGGTPPPPPTPPGLPVVGAVVSGISLSKESVVLGQTMDLTCTIVNDLNESLFLQALYTEPSAVAPFSEVTVTAQTNHVVNASLIVSEIPGVYPVRVTFHGLAPTKVYRAVGQGGTEVTVTRPDIPLPLADKLSASLGPTGTDRVGTDLAKGTKVLLELRGDVNNGMLPSLAVLGPDGLPVKWAPGKIVKAKKAGVHVFAVANGTENRGQYQLFTQPVGSAKVPAVPGLLAAGQVTEVPMFLYARTGGTLTVAGSKKLGLRVVGLRSPSGKEFDFDPAQVVTIPAFGEDGAWTVRVDGTAGLGGKFKVAFKGEWLPGKAKAE